LEAKRLEIDPSFDHRTGSRRTQYQKMGPTIMPAATISKANPFNKALQRLK